MNHGVHHCFPQGGQRISPALNTAHSLNHRFPSGVSLYECDGFFNGNRQMGTDLHRIEDSPAVGAQEATGLNPRIRKMSAPFLVKEKRAARRGQQLALVPRREAESLQIPAGEPLDPRKRLGGSSEVNSFQVEFRQQVFVEGLFARVASELVNQSHVGVPVG